MGHPPANSSTAILRPIRHVRFIRPAVSLLIVAGLVAGTLPIPLPRTGAWDGPFPCAGGSCGCADAATCWTSCCCHSPAERLAWAAEHGVVPPNADDLRDAAALEEEAADPHAGPPCCAPPVVAASSRRVAAAPGCSRKSADAAAGSRRHGDASHTLSALACRGLLPTVGLLGQPLALPPAGVAVCRSGGFSPAPRTSQALRPVGRGGPSVPPG